MDDKIKELMIGGLFGLLLGMVIACFACITTDHHEAVAHGAATYKVSADGTVTFTWNN